MKKLVNLMPLMAMVILSAFCSCNSGNKTLTDESLNISADDVLELINKQSVSKEEMSALAEKSGMSMVNEIEEKEELPGDWEEDGQEAPYQVIYALLSGRGVIQKDCKDNWGERKYSLAESEDRGFGIIIEGESTIEDHNDFILSSIRLAFTFREEANDFEETVEKKGKFALTDDGKQINGAGLILSSYEENKLHWVEIARLIEH